MSKFKFPYKQIKQLIYHVVLQVELSYISTKSKWQINQENNLFMIQLKIIQVTMINFGSSIRFIMKLINFAQSTHFNKFILPCSKLQINNLQNLCFMICKYGLQEFKFYPSESLNLESLKVFEIIFNKCNKLKLNTQLHRNVRKQHNNNNSQDKNNYLYKQNQSWMSNLFNYKNKLHQTIIQAQMSLDRAKAETDASFLAANLEVNLYPKLFSPEYLSFQGVSAFTQNVTMILGDRIPNIVTNLK